MVGVSASQFPPTPPPRTLRPGDVLEYYSQGFVCGDPRELRVGDVLKISSANDTFPTAQATRCSSTTCAGANYGPSTWLLGPSTRPRELLVNDVRWRKLRSFDLVAGSFNASTRAARLQDALTAAIDEAFAIAGNDSVSSCLTNKGLALTPPRDTEAASSALTDPRVFSKNSLDAPVHEVVDYTAGASGDEVLDADDDLPRAFVARVSDDEANSCRGQAPVSPPWSRNKLRRTVFLNEREVTDADLLDARRFVESVPTHYQRKNAATKEVQDRRIYHAHLTKAQQGQAIQRLAGLRKRLRELHERRPTYQEPPFIPIEDPWPTSVTKLTVCNNPDNASFKDIGDFGGCECVGDCFLDSCSNTTGALYGTSES
ncbi:hypothetical protein L916_17050 [Phytophthora nicotianae]|uniref:Uncharacterized protein n=1 Tax=Phytophthora nicotianae TaxID=4792 RepID=W2I6U7_PHYNI|nr:hypothetical protein L916_17050 [Phytophthora nicotianae]